MTKRKSKLEARFLRRQKCISSSYTSGVIPSHAVSAGKWIPGYHCAALVAIGQHTLILELLLAKFGGSEVKFQKVLQKEVLEKGSLCGKKLHIVGRIWRRLQEETGKEMQEE
jgi:hypothetical protein